MKRKHHLASALVSTALLGAPPALAQAPSIRALVQNGDTFGPWTMTGIDSSSIGDDGTWAAVLRDGAYDTFLVRDGNLVGSVGDVRHGAVIEHFESVHVSREGTISSVYTVIDPNDPNNELTRVDLGASLVLSEGDPIVLPSHGIDADVIHIYGAQFQGDDAMIACAYQGTSGYSRAILFGSVQTGSFVPTDAVEKDTTLPGHSNTLLTFTNDIDFEPSGRWGATVLLNPSYGKGLAYMGQGLAEEGGTGAAPNSTWTFTSNPRVRVNRFDNHIESGKIQLATGPERGAVYRGSQPLAIEGGLVQGVPGDTVDAFNTAKVDIDDNNDPYFIVPFTSGNDRLMGGGETLIEVDVTTVDGNVVYDIFAGNLGGGLSVSGDGRLVLVEGRIDNVGTSLMLVEREIGEPLSCATTPNSTGAQGKLDAEGSRYLAENDLHLVASDLPPSQFGLLLTSLDEGFTANPGGSAGNLCLGGAIGRFNGQITPSSAAGLATFHPDLGALPQPMGTVGAMVGERWNFQVWHRDVVGGVQTSNLTRTTAVTVL